MNLVGAVAVLSLIRAFSCLRYVNVCVCCVVFCIRFARMTENSYEFVIIKKNKNIMSTFHHTDDTRDALHEQHTAP